MYLLEVAIGGGIFGVVTWFTIAFISGKKDKEEIDKVIKKEANYLINKYLREGRVVCPDCGVCNKIIVEQEF